MSDLIIRPFPTDSHWTYDDPSGVADEPLEVPPNLRGSVEQAAARDGLSATEWLRRLVLRGLAPYGPKAA